MTQLKSEVSSQGATEPNNTEPKVWFITGCTTGFGKQLTLEALKRGDRVIATGRGDLSRLQKLKDAGAHIMTCDVTVSSAEMKKIAEDAWNVYGKVDIVVNNAGYGFLGPIEEVGPEGFLEQYKTNVFGVQNVNCAFLPYLRARRSGTIVVIGSRSGTRVWPVVGVYGTSKAAINAYGEVLAKEIAPFGIRVLTVIPGGYFTDGFATSPSLAKDFEGHHLYDDYNPLRKQFEKMLETFTGSQLGDPIKFASILLDVVRGEGMMIGNDGKVRPWPERLFMGSDAAQDYRNTIESWEKSLEEYKDLTVWTDRWKYEPPQK